MESGEKLPKKETSGDSPKKIPGKIYFLCIMGDNTCLADQMIQYIMSSTYNTFLIVYILHKFFYYDFKAIISSKYIQQNEQFGKKIIWHLCAWNKYVLNFCTLNKKW